MFFKKSIEERAEEAYEKCLEHGIKLMKEIEGLKAKNEYLRNEIRGLKEFYCEQIQRAAKTIELKDKYIFKMLETFVNLSPKLPITREEYDKLNEQFWKEIQHENDNTGRTDIKNETAL
jgi:predicted RNase H-like nuclease (RuvC/YqgF family)